MRRTLKFLAAAAVAALPAIAGAQTIRVAGYGQGCFYKIGGPLCTNFSNVANSAAVLAGSSLTYNGGTSSAFNFDSFTSNGFIGIGGTPDNFGTLTTNNVSFNYGNTVGAVAPQLGFRLLVTFD